MNLLSVIMSGLRAFRVPFAVGLVWLGTITLALYPYSAVLGKNPAFDSVAGLYESLPQSAQLGVAAFTAYALGMVATDVPRDISRKFGRRWRRTLFEKAELEIRSWLALWQVWEWLYPALAVSEVINGKILSATLGRHDHGLLRALLPTSLLHAESDLAALRLSKEAPEQFQQYDRIVSAADLRRGLAVPIFVFSLTLGVMAESLAWTPVIVVTGAVLSLFLSTQAHRRQNEAGRQILTAIGLSWTSTPALMGIREQLDEIDRQPTSEVRRLGAKATAIVSVVIETLQGSTLTRYMSGLRHPSRAQILQEHLRSDALSKIYGKDLGNRVPGQRATVEGRHRALRSESVVAR